MVILGAATRPKMCFTVVTHELEINRDLSKLCYKIVDGP